jgi:hypothetical protein
METTKRQELKWRYRRNEISLVEYEALMAKVEAVEKANEAERGFYAPLSSGASLDENAPKQPRPPMDPPVYKINI